MILLSKTTSKKVLITVMYRFANLEDDCFGGVSSSISSTVGDYKSDYSRNAYMLIYEKRRKEQMKVIFPEQLMKQCSQSLGSLDCDGTAISRGD